MSDERDDGPGGDELPPPPNLIPGPADRGGHGGMATREADARKRGEDPEPLATP